MAWRTPRRDDTRTLKDCYLGHVVRVGEWCHDPPHGRVQSAARLRRLDDGRTTCDRLRLYAERVVRRVNEMVCAGIPSGSAAAGRKEGAVDRRGFACHAGGD